MKQELRKIALEKRKNILDRKCKDEKIASALHGLSEEQRDIILLAYFLDMTDQEIADKLNAVRRTVQYKRVRALENMRIGLEVMTDGNSNVEEE